MGKPITQSSLKISKKEPNHQLNTRVKILKPKVYIIHSSNFKTLVQRVTGNNTSSSSSPVSSLVSTQPPPPQVIHIDDYHGSPDPSLDLSSDPSLDNTFMSFDYNYCSSEELGVSSFSPPSAMHVVSSEHTQVIHIDEHDSPDRSSDNTFMPSNYSYYSSEELGVTSFSPPTMHVLSSEHTQMIHSNEHDSPDTSLDNTFMPSDYSYCSNEELGVQWPQDRALDYVDHEIQLKNLESWLLDFDPSTCALDGPSSIPMNTYEYGYNFSSIM